jgi:hypothetical protein
MKAKKAGLFAKFEKSGGDNDKGMKEGGKKDMLADKKQMAAMKMKPKKGAKK